MKILAVALLLVAVACGDSDQPAGDAGDAAADGTVAPVDDGVAPASLDGAWSVVSMTLDGVRVDPLADWPLTMTIDGDRIGGTAACNGYGGALTATADAGFGSFVVSELSWTEMGCEPEVMESEQAFLSALQQIDSYELADELFLAATGAGTNIQLARQAPVPAAELVGTTWVLDTYLDGDAASNLPFMELATLTLADDGTFTGSTSCRRLEGEWLVTGATLQFPTFSAIDDPLAGVCAPESETLDGLIISVLEGPLGVDIDGRRLTLTAPGGEGLSYVAGEPSDEVPPAAPDTDADGGVDGPVMYARHIDRDEPQMAAEIRGTLELDGDCLSVVRDQVRYPVLWPNGTTWDDARRQVTLPDGDTVPVGGELQGGGGYLYPDALGGFTEVEEVLALADACAEPPYFEIAVLQGY